MQYMMIAEANLPAMWFHPDSYQPVTKCQNNGFKIGAPLYRHWGSLQAVRPIGGIEV